MSKQPPLDDRCSPWPWSQVATMSSDFTFIRRIEDDEGHLEPIAELADRAVVVGLARLAEDKGALVEDAATRGRDGEGVPAVAVLGGATARLTVTRILHDLAHCLPKPPTGAVTRLDVERDLAHMFCPLRPRLGDRRKECKKKRATDPPIDRSVTYRPVRERLGALIEALPPASIPAVKASRFALKLGRLVRNLRPLLALYASMAALAEPS